MIMGAGGGFQIEPWLALTPILIAAAYFDLRYLRIPNLLCITAFAAFLFFAVLYPPPDLVPRLAVAGAIFLLGTAGFALRLLGRGEMTFLPVLVLFVPLHRLAIFGNVLTVSLLLGLALILILRRMPRFATADWQSFGGRAKLPLGLCMALAGLSFPWVSLALG